MEDAKVPEFKVRLFGVIGSCQYELPSGDSVGAIVFESGPNTATDYNVIIEQQSGFPQRIQKLHPCYMSLQFQLLFIYGQEGYHLGLKLLDVPGTFSRKQKKVSINMYYAYQLHEHQKQYTLLTRGSHQFQKYVVTTYFSVEQSQFNYVRENPDDIRNEYLSGLYNAIMRGDRDGSDVGSRTILTTSFTEGPRYMYSHYLDTLAICRVHRNPSFFITFTCNMKRPEIGTFMKAFPEVTFADRPDVVVRVFEHKIHDLVTFLQDAKPFRNFYTLLSSKKRPTICHLLLWIAERSRMPRDEDVDIYISTELPHLWLDPKGYKVTFELMMHGLCGLANKTAAGVQNSDTCVIVVF
ncbi:DNA helicase [Tanacetum coccineum]